MHQSAPVVAMQGELLPISVTIDVGKNAVKNSIRSSDCMYNLGQDIK